jgi:hypothetical protein
MPPPEREGSPGAGRRQPNSPTYTRQQQTAQQWLDETFALVRRAFDEAEADPGWWTLVARPDKLSWPLTPDDPPYDPDNWDVAWIVLYFTADGWVVANTTLRMGVRGGQTYVGPTPDPDADPRCAVVLPAALAERARGLRSRALGGS